MEGFTPGPIFKKGPHLCCHECLSNIIIATKPFGIFQTYKKNSIDFVLYVQNINSNIILGARLNQGTLGFAS